MASSIHYTGASTYPGAGAVTTVTIGVTMANTSYRVHLTPTAATSGTLGEVYITNKTATAFDINNTGSFTGANTWLVIP